MKIALVYSFKESDWFSVTKILNNLIASYKAAYSQESIVEINFPWDWTEEDLEESIKSLKDANVDKIVFLDHKPNPVIFLKELGRSEIEKFKEIVIHAYGDFTLEFHRWSNFHYLMKDINVKFVCASHKQKDLVQGLFTEEIPVYVCPFPVADAEFYYAEENVDSIRKKYNISENDTIFLYVGRLSTQKRNLETIETFLKLRHEGVLDKGHKFLIAGGYDLLGQHYLREGLLLGEYFRRIMQVMEKYPQDVRDSVQLLGSIKNTELIPFYNTADYFLSMSTYHDEDYGMAVAESLCCGLPCIITDWAGYSSFNLGDKKATRYVGVELGIKTPEFDREELSSLLIQAKDKKVAPQERKEIANKYKSAITVSACAKIIKEIHDAPSAKFIGFKEIVHRLGLIAHFKGNPFLNEFNNCYNNFYYEIYDCYARKNS